MRMFQRCIGVLWLVGLSACGGAEEEPAMNEGTRVRFRSAQLSCDLSEVEVWLSVQGIEGRCILDFTQDGQVEGVCEPIPVGEARNFQLVYAIQRPDPFDPNENRWVNLAWVTQQVDLRSENRERVVVDFSDLPIKRDFDDDGDGKTNLLEYCQGSDPLKAD